MSRISPALPMEISFLNDVKAWDGLAGPWNDLLTRSAVNVPFLRHEFLRTWWTTLGGGEWPDGELSIAVARGEGGALAAVAPLFRTSPHPRTLLFIGTTEIADYLDVVAPAPAIDSFARTLLEAVPREGPAAIDTLDLWNVLETSPAGQAFSHAGRSAGWSLERQRLKPCPLVDLAGGWPGYLERLEKKQRHELRRKMRRVEQTAGATFVRAGDGLELESAVEAFLELMRFDEAKSRFLTPPMRRMFQTLARTAAQAGWLRLELLMVESRPASAAFCFDYGDRLLVYNSGMDPAYQSLSPGWALLGHLIRSAGEEGKAAVDFLRGEEAYKLRLGGEARYVERLTLRRG